MIDPRVKGTKEEFEAPYQLPGAFKVIVVKGSTWNAQARLMGRKLGLKQGDTYPIRALMKQMGVDVEPYPAVISEPASDSVVVLSRI